MTALADLAGQVEWPDHTARTQAHDAFSARPELGRLADLIEWLAGAQALFPVRDITRARLIVVAMDHPIASSGVSRFGPADTARTVESITTGSAPLCELAALAAAGIRLEELGPDPSPTAAFDRGVAVADDEIDAGTDLLIVGNLGAGSTTTAAAAAAVLLGVEPVKVVGRGGSQIDDLAWMHKVSAIRDARRQGWPHRHDPMALLEALGAADLAFLAGLLLRAAGRRTPVLLDGLVTAVAALLGDQARPGTRQWWRPAQRSGEPAQAAVLHDLSLEPVIDLGLQSGDGTGGLVALGVLRSALALTGSVARET